MRESTYPSSIVRHLSLIYRRRTRKSLYKAVIASRIAQVHPAGRGHVGDALPPRVDGQRACVPAERLRDGPVVEFGIGRAAFGTDIGANYGGGKRLRHLTYARDRGYSWVGVGVESFSFAAATFGI